MVKAAVACHMVQAKLDAPGNFLTSGLRYSELLAQSARLAETLTNSGNSIPSAGCNECMLPLSQAPFHKALLTMLDIHTELPVCSIVALCSWCVHLLAIHRTPSPLPCLQARMQKGQQLPSWHPPASITFRAHGAPGSMARLQYHCASVILPGPALWTSCQFGMCLLDVMLHTVTMQLHTLPYFGTSAM